MFEILPDEGDLDSKFVQKTKWIIEIVAKTLFQVVSIAVFVEVSFEKNEKVDVKSTLLMI